MVRHDMMMCGVREHIAVHPCKCIICLFATVILTLSNALAGERIVAMNMTCSAIKSIIERDGSAIVLYRSRSIPGLTLVDRFVSAANFCESAKRAPPKSIRTRDDANCAIPVCREQVDDVFN